MARTPVLDIDAMLADRHTRIVVCCGSGGVGKTTTAAALALRAAEAGREVVVLTIDPARRLAQSLGLTELDNVPRLVSGLAGDAVPGGRLDAPLNSDPTAAAKLSADLEAVGLDLPRATVEGLLDEVHRHTERVALEVEQLTVLEQLGQPLVTVPFLIDGVDLDAITEIADLLADQGMVS